MEAYLEHHGIKGQKWGVRRFQNADGTLTSAGRKRYGEDYKSNKTKRLEKASEKVQRDIDSYDPIRGKDQTRKNGKVYLTKEEIENLRNVSVEAKRKIDTKIEESKEIDRSRSDEKPKHASAHKLVEKYGNLTPAGRAVKIGVTAVSTALGMYGAKTLRDKAMIEKYLDKMTMR